MLSGARWDSEWRTPKGCNQLHLFLAAFPPSREDSSLYRKLLKGALGAGLDPGTAESDKGRSGLFLLVEQMAVTPSDQCPEATRVMHMALDSCSDPARAVGTADRTGRTVLDVEEKVEHSCLGACRSILKDAAHRSNGIGGAQQRDWEMERPRTSSAIIARAGSSAPSSARDRNRDNHHSRNGSHQGQAMRSASTDYSSRDYNNHSTATGGGGGGGGRPHSNLGAGGAGGAGGYLTDGYSNPSPVPLLGSGSGARRGGRGAGGTGSAASSSNSRGPSYDAYDSPRSSAYLTPSAGAGAGAGAGAAKRYY